MVEYDHFRNDVKWILIIKYMQDEHKMADNGKKEFPINGLEEDVTSKFARKIYCYLHNCRGIKKWTKAHMNRRFRRRSKEKCRQALEKEVL